jgi:hypothetical protein
MEPNSDVMFTILGSSALSRLGRKCLHVKKGPWTVSVRGGGKSVGRAYHSHGLEAVREYLRGLFLPGFWLR